MTIRRATPDDAAWAADLHRAWLTAPGQGRLAAWLSARGGARAAMALGWVAERGGRRVGLGVAETAPPGAPTLHLFARRAPAEALAGWRARFPASWFGRGLAVVPEARRAGVGRALVQARVEAARAAGAPAFFAACLAGSGSEPLYRGLGFSVLARVPFVQGGPDAALVGLALEPALRSASPPPPPAG